MVVVAPSVFQQTVTAQEAVHTRMADKIVKSREEALAFLGVSDAKKQPTKVIDESCQKNITPNVMEY